MFFRVMQMEMYGYGIGRPQEYCQNGRLTISAVYLCFGIRMKPQKLQLVVGMALLNFGINW